MEEVRLPFSERLSTRQWIVVDVVAAGLLAGGAAGEILAGTVGPAGPVWTSVRAVAVGTACAALPFRRRFPLAVLFIVGLAVALIDALGGNLAGPDGGVVALALIPAVYTVVVDARRRTAIVGVSVVALAIATGALTGAGGPDWGAALFGLTFAALGWLAGANARARQRYLEGVLERAAERERQRDEEAQRAAADERLRIARELHDVVAHAISVIAVRSGVARMALDVRPDETRQSLGIIEATSRQALEELRHVVGMLRSTDDTPANRAPAPGLCDLAPLVA